MDEEWVTKFRSWSLNLVVKNNDQPTKDNPQGNNVKNLWDPYSRQNGEPVKNLWEPGN